MFVCIHVSDYIHIIINIHTYIYMVMVTIFSIMILNYQSPIGNRLRGFPMSMAVGE